MNKRFIFYLIFAIIFSVALVLLFGNDDEPVEVDEVRSNYNFVDPEYSLIPFENIIQQKKIELIRQGKLFPPTQQDYIDSLED